MHAKATPEQRSEFLRLVTDEGHSIEIAAGRVGFSRQWGQKVWKEVQERGGALVRKSQPDIPEALTRPLALHELSDIARDCLGDFGRWRARYFGRKSSPWQEHAASEAARLLGTQQKEYAVVNCPPGTGKSTLFTHDIPAWFSCRDRALRQFIGSSTNTLATSYVRRLRNTYVRKVPLDAKAEEVRLGLAYDAMSTLCLDYGMFKPDPELGAPWTASQFTISQIGETPVGEKEATCTAFGRDTGFLGWRVNFIVWDDLVRRQDFIGDNKVIKLETDRAWWDDEAETRIEPGGLLILQGQRLGPEDLYRYNKDKLSYAEEEDYFDFGEEELPTYKKYYVIKYKAHYEEHCKAKIDPSTHARVAEAYDPNNPDNSGCLLDPLRLPWRECKMHMNKPLSNWDTVYQQEDIDPENVLVPKHFVDGGDYEGHAYVGCWDDERAPGTPPTLPSRGVRLTKSIITADPSPTKFWAIQWWLYVELDSDEHLMGRRYLLDQIFKPMGANDFLDFDVMTGEYEGFLVEWEHRARKVNLPIQHLILEANAAQKFMSQYKFFKHWLSSHSIKLKSHHTHVNKLDAKMGVTTIRNHYQFGRVRLPGTTTGREVAKPLYDQVTNYPEYSYDDAVMAHWFLEYQLQHLVKRGSRIKSIFNDMPSWLPKEPSYG